VSEPGKWTERHRRQVYESEWLNVWLDDVELPDGRVIEHHALRMPRASVTVVALNDQREALLIWRHRFITDTWGWEVPAGWIDPGESPAEAASREAEEETGFRVGELRELASYYAMPGLADHHFTVFAADGAEDLGRDLDPTETAKVEWVPLEDYGRLLHEGTLTDGPSITALGLALALTSSPSG
jgi:8-oxo-dGTP pyrophosphatase MutT (NUDIX family)